jgi:galactose mutarotase-like enzyme
MYYIQNDYLIAKINAKGAELQSVVLKSSDVNYMWEGNPANWAKFSPVLFPIVGALKDNTYFFKGNAYQLPRHGFARDMVFEANQISNTEIDFVLTYNEETLAKYPFKFKLTLKYSLKENNLTCIYVVENIGEDEMFFSLGAHPAFAAPLNNEGQYTDYFLEFDKDEELNFYHVVDNLLVDTISVLKLQNKSLPLNYQLFYKDALVFKNLKSKNIRLLNHKNAKGLGFEFDNFPYFGIWAAIDANFVCLEPWQGVADHANHDQNLEHKEGVLNLESKASWQAFWQINCF